VSQTPIGKKGNDGNMLATVSVFLETQTNLKALVELTYRPNPSLHWKLLPLAPLVNFPLGCTLKEADVITPPLRV